MADRTGPERDDEGVRAFVEHLAMTLADYGFPRMPSRVLAALMATEEESLTAAELAARLGVSPAAISGAVRYLLYVGLIQRVPVAGSRRDRYRLPADPWYESSSLKSDFMTKIADIADDGVKALGADTPAGARVARMRDFFLFAHAELDVLLEKWRTERPWETA